MVPQPPETTPFMEKELQAEVRRLQAEKDNLTAQLQSATAPSQETNQGSSGIYDQESGQADVLMEMKPIFDRKDVMHFLADAKS